MSTPSPRVLRPAGQMGGRRDALGPDTPGEMCISCGTAERLHPFFLRPRHKPFTKEKPRRTQQGLYSRFRTCKQPLGSPAQLLLSAKAPSSGFPLLSIYYYYYVQVVLHQKTPSPPLSPCSSSPTAAPQPCLFLKTFLQPRGVMESKA